MDVSVAHIRLAQHFRAWVEHGAGEQLCAAGAALAAAAEAGHDHTGVLQALHDGVGGLGGYLAAVGEGNGEDVALVHVFRPAGELPRRVGDDLDLLPYRTAGYAELLQLAADKVVHHVRAAHVEGTSGDVAHNLPYQLAGDKAGTVGAVLAGVGYDVVDTHIALGLELVQLRLGDDVVLAGAAVDEVYVKAVVELVRVGLQHAQERGYAAAAGNEYQTLAVDAGQAVEGTGRPGTGNGVADLYVVEHVGGAEGVGSALYGYLIVSALGHGGAERVGAAGPDAVYLHVHVYELSGPEGRDIAVHRRETESLGARAGFGYGSDAVLYLGRVQAIESLVVPAAAGAVVYGKGLADFNLLYNLVEVGQPFKFSQVPHFSALLCVVVEYTFGGVISAGHGVVESAYEYGCAAEVQALYGGAHLQLVGNQVLHMRVHAVHAAVERAKIAHQRHGRGALYFLNVALYAGVVVVDKVQHPGQVLVLAIEILFRRAVYEPVRHLAGQDGDYAGTLRTGFGVVNVVAAYLHAAEVVGADVYVEAVGKHLCGVGDGAAEAGLVDDARLLGRAVQAQVHDEDGLARHGYAQIVKNLLRDILFVYHVYVGENLVAVGEHRVRIVLLAVCAAHALYGAVLDKYFLHRRVELDRAAVLYEFVGDGGGNCGAAALDIAGALPALIAERHADEGADVHGDTQIAVVGGVHSDEQRVLEKALEQVAGDDGAVLIELGEALAADGLLLGEVGVHLLELLRHLVAELLIAVYGLCLLGRHLFQQVLEALVRARDGYGQLVADGETEGLMLHYELQLVIYAQVLEDFSQRAFIPTEVVGDSVELVQSRLELKASAPEGRAGAAGDIVLLDEQRVLAALLQRERTDVATGTRADNNSVVFFHCSLLLVLKGLQVTALNLYHCSD